MLLRLRQTRLAAAGVTCSLAAAAGFSSLSSIRPSALAQPAAPPTNLRVTSYNVLSSSLCEPEHFVACAPEDLKPETRLGRVCSALEDQMTHGAVICLQEVSAKWAGDFTPFFEANGYTLVTSLYGNRFNGYMGVALAWPKELYQSEAVDISRVADTRRWPPPRVETRPLLALVRGAWSKVEQLWRKPRRKPLDPHTEAARRYNVLISARLRCKKTGRRFCVSNYHMPCLFGSDAKMQVMVMHTALAAQHATRFAEGHPHVLAGDFNIQPGSSPYRLLTQGSLPAEDPHQPPKRDGETWESSLAQPYVSAYAESLGSEPEFTNYAVTKFSKEPFMETLDYILVAPGEEQTWNVTSVRPLPGKKAIAAREKSYPSSIEPSDHVLIWSDLELAEGKKSEATEPKAA